MEQTPISPATGKDDQPTLYKPEFEHDACGIGALASIKGERSHQILDDALSVLVNLEHRGGVGSSATPVTRGHSLPGPPPILPQGGTEVRASPARRGRLRRGDGLFAAR